MSDIDLAGRLRSILADIAILDAIIDDIHDTDLPAVKTDTGNILADTGELQVDWTNGGRLDLILDAVKAKTDLIPADMSAQVDTLDDVKAKTDLIPADMTAQLDSLDDILTDTGELQPDMADGGRLDLLIDAIKAKTDTYVVGIKAPVLAETIVGSILSTAAYVIPSGRRVLAIYATGTYTTNTIIQVQRAGALWKNTYDISHSVLIGCMDGSYVLVDGPIPVSDGTNVRIYNGAGGTVVNVSYLYEVYA